MLNASNECSKKVEWPKEKWKNKRLEKSVSKDFKWSARSTKKKNKLLTKNKKLCRWSFLNSSLLRNFKTLKPFKLKLMKNSNRQSNRSSLEQTSASTVPVTTDFPSLLKWVGKKASTPSELKQ